MSLGYPFRAALQESGREARLFWPRADCVSYCPDGPERRITFASRALDEVDQEEDIPRGRRPVGHG